MSFMIFLYYLLYFIISIDSTLKRIKNNFAYNRINLEILDRFYASITAKILVNYF